MEKNIKEISIKPKKRFNLAAKLALFLIVVLLAFNSNLNVVHYEVDSNKITHDIRIAFIADLHSCYYGEKQSDLLKRVYEQNPDIVLFGGDIIDDGLPQKKNAITVLDALSKEYPCYYVSGNHEYWTNKIDDIKQAVQNCGVKVLDGICETVAINGQTINICGIDDAEAGESIMFDQLKDAYKHADPNVFTVLLAHRPEYIDTYRQYPVDLTLSGHTHGGQSRLPLLINGLFAPGQGWFPQYAGGQYVLRDEAFIVSRGLSRESSRFPRIFNPPELVIIDITANENTVDLF